jgi:sortase A
MRKARKAPEDLTVEELHRLLMEKRRKTRQEHLQRFRRTGRVMALPSEYPPADLSRPVYAPYPTSLPTPARSLRRALLDGLLLVVEIVAVFGLLWVLYSGFIALRTINEESLVALELPTFTPTPRIMAAVLPSGHTPPTAPGGAAPNEAEIPEHLRPLVQQLASLPLPTPGPQQATRIQIPSIGVDAPIVQGDGWEQLKKGVGQHIGTANPGENGNLVLSAHNDIFGEIFRDLDRLKAGDQVIVHTTNQRTFTYVITQTEIVEPTRVEVMAPTPDGVVTLISCYPYLVNNKRIVVRAALQD